MKNFILSIFVITFLFACQKEEDLLFPSHQIDLSNLQVGQTAKYVNYHTFCGTMEEDFEFLGDTLLLKVIEESGKLYFSEALSPFSKSVINGGGWEPVKYPVEKQSYKLKMVDRTNSKLFYFYGNDYLTTRQPLKVKYVQQNGCKLDLNEQPFIGNEITKLQSFKLGPMVFNNKTVVSCIPVVLELEAYLIYDNHELSLSHSVRTSIFNGHTSDYVSGWCLVKE